MRSAKRLEEDLRRERLELWDRPLDRFGGIVQRAVGQAALHACARFAKRIDDGEAEMPSADELPDEIARSWRDWRRAGQHQIPPPPSALLPIQRPSAELWSRARAEWREERSVRLLFPLGILRAYREEYGDASKAERHELAP